MTASVENGNYWLFEVPLYLRFSTADDLLNPTKGCTLEYTATGALNVAQGKDFYLVNQFTESFYYSLDAKSAFIFAQQLTLGSILSQDLTSSPLCRRYLGGSEQELRGYRYRSVSPFKDGKPIGGRSAIYLTVECRFRVSKTIGIVPFFDLGNVERSILPLGDGKWYKSTGVGLRYFSFMGPFRIDVAFPLDRRKGIDPVYKILASIGQTF
ncbi:MAG: BamA/TamA family outer membrane protein [Chlamydiales bacterium]|nr:BamA/TamA family outer membrane protein [Chlamydiales bacterium]